MNESRYVMLVNQLKSNNPNDIISAARNMKSSALNKNNVSSQLIRLGILNIMLDILSKLSSSNKQGCGISNTLLSLFANWCIDHERARHFFAEKNKIELILRFWGEDWPDSVKERAARLLANLMISPKVRSVLMHTEALPGVSKLLCKATLKHNQLIYCKLLKQLCQTESERGRCVEVGGVLALAKLLLSPEPEVSGRALQTLCDLTSLKCSTGFASQIIKADVIKRLLMWCKSDSNDRLTSDSKDCLKSDSRDRLTSDSNDRLKSDSNDRLTSDSKDCLKSDSRDRLTSDSMDRLKSDSRDRLKSDCMDRLKSDSNDRFKSDSNDRLKSDSKDRLKSDSRDRLKSDSMDRLKSDSNDRLKRDSNDRFKSDSNDRIKSDSNDRFKSDSKDRLKSDSNDRLKSDSKDRLKSDSRDRLKSDSNDRLKSDSNDRFKSDSKDRLKSDSKDRFKSDSNDRIKSDSNDRLKSDSRDCLKSDSMDRLKSDSNDRLKSDSRDRLKSDSNDRFKSDSNDRLKSDSRDHLKSDSRDRLKSDSNDRFKSDRKDRLKSDSNDRLKSDNRDRLKSDSRDRLKSDSNDRFKSDSNDRLKSDSKDRLKSDSRDRLKSDSMDRLKSDGNDRFKSDSKDRLKSDSNDRFKSDRKDRLKSDSRDRLKSDSNDRLKSDSNDRFKNALTLVLNLTAQPESRVAIGNEGGVECLLETLAMARSRGFRWDKLMNGLCFLSLEAVNRVRLRESGFLTVAQKYLGGDEYAVIHRRLISSITYFLYDDNSVEELSNERFVSLLLSHLKQTCMFNRRCFNRLEPTQIALDIFASRGSLDVSGITAPIRGSKRHRSFETDDPPNTAPPDKAYKLGDGSEALKRCSETYVDEVTRVDTDVTTREYNVDEVTRVDTDVMTREHNVDEVTRVYTDVTTREYNVDEVTRVDTDVTTREYNVDEVTRVDANVTTHEHNQSSMEGQYSPVESYTNNCHSCTQVSVDDSEDRGEAASEAAMFRVNSPTYQEQIRKNSESNPHLDRLNVNRWLKYGPLTNVNHSSPDSVRSVAKFHYSPCQTYGPVASPLSNSGNSSPISFQSSVINEYSSEEELHSDEEDKTDNVSKCEDQRKQKLNMDVELNSDIDSKYMVINYTNVVKSKPENKLNCHAQNVGHLSKEDQDKPDVSNKFDLTSDEIVKIVDTKTESNIVSILAAMSYHPSHACIVTKEQVCCLLDYLTNFKPLNTRVLRILECLARQTLLFEKFVSIEAPRLISARMLDFKYDRDWRRLPTQGHKPNVTSPHHDTRRVSSDAVPTASTTSSADWLMERTVDEERHEAGCKLLRALSGVCSLWYGVGTLERLLLTGDSVCQLRTAVGMLYILRNQEAMQQLLVQNGMLYGMLCMLLTNECNDTTHAVIGGLHFLARTLTGDGRGDDHEDTVEFPLVARRETVAACRYDHAEHDLTLVMDGRGYPCERATVARSSPVFAAMLHGDFKEARADSITLHPLSHTGHEAFAFLLHYLHGCGTACHLVSSLIGPAPQGTQRSRLYACLGVSQLADYYKMCEMSRYVNHVITSRCRSLSTMCDLYEFAVCQVDTELGGGCLEYLLTCDGCNTERVEALMSLMHTYGQVILDAIYNIIKTKLCS